VLSSDVDFDRLKVRPDRTERKLVIVD